MPFQSEKQRKYLWANEPEIAREWTDKYGSRVKKDNGGIMDAWGRHATASEAMKLMNQPDYHQKAGYNFMQNFPNTPNWLANTLATGYQYGSEGFKALKGGTDFSDAMARAKEESRLNKLGIQGLGFDMGEYENFMQNYNTANDISPALQKAIDEGTSYSEFDRIPNEKYFGLDIQRNYVPTGSMNDLYKTASLNQSGNYPQSQDLEAQASGMFKEEDEDENFIDRMRKYTMPAYNFMRGKVGAGLMGLMNPLAGLTMFAGGKNLRNSAAYRPATQGAYKYSPAQLNRMNALGGYYSEPARQQRRTVNRVNNMMARKAADKSYSTPNLSNLSAQISRGRDPSQGNTVTGHGKSGMGRDPSDRMAQGGLASLWQR